MPPSSSSCRRTSCAAARTARTGLNTIRAVLKGREFTGSQVIYYLETAQGVEVKMVLQEPFTEGEGTEINSEWSSAGRPRTPSSSGTGTRASREHGLRSASLRTGVP